MRRLLWLVLIVLTGCGGGGGAIDAGGSVTTERGFLALQVSQQPLDAAVKSVTALEAVDPARVRVVVSNPAIAYRKIVDLALGEPMETIPLPAVGGYRAELVYYRPGTPNLLTHYGVVNGISIISESTTLKAATMKPIQVTFGVPVLITPGVPYDIADPGAATLEASGLQSKWSLASRYSPFTSRLHLAQAPTSVHTRLPSSLYVDGPYAYFQGEFFLKPELLDDGEKEWDFAYTAESAAVRMNVGYLVINIGGFTETVKPVVRSVSVPQGKLPSGLVSPVGIVAEDNGEVKAYLITESPAPPVPQDSRWLSVKPASYTCAASGLVSGQDNRITLYFWAKDYSGNVSELTPASQATVVINDSAAP